MDTLHLHVRGGTGGAGLSLYGGLGGSGGSIYLVAKDGITLEKVLKTLKAKRIKADSGNDSSSRGIIGASGEDKIITVPRGITVYNQNGVLLGWHIIFIFIFKVYMFVVTFLFFLFENYIL